jgi:peptidyl-prolyl cis-trans isomerase SurA
MKRFSFVLAFLALAPALQAQRDSTANPRSIPIDRVVAVVGTQPILWSDVIEMVNLRRAEGQQVPEDSVGQMVFARQVLSQIVDEEVLVQRARGDTAIAVDESDVQNTVDQQIQRMRSQFKTDGEFIRVLREGGFGTQEEYRRWLAEQARRRSLQEQLIQHMRREGRMIAVAVSEDEISKAFEQNRGKLPKRPATVTFRQIVIPTMASDSARAKARAKADTLVREIRGGAEFEQIAKRESMDPQSKEQGGDLGWNRRNNMVPAFDAMMFALPPGQVSPIVETIYGFHIIRVDRVKPGEVKARHILIKPTFDSTDIERTAKLADSVATLWRNGTPYDTLAAKFHDEESGEAKTVLDPFERAKLPESYQKAFEGKKSSDLVAPFPIADPQRGVPKFVIAQLETVAEEGDYTVQDLRNQIRDQLSQEKSFRRFIDTLKSETYVSIRLDEANTATGRP